jgi:cyclophilin family peptidyl-prolyl cis-trans isomerase/HEAT repeat protein
MKYFLVLCIVLAVIAGCGGGTGKNEPGPAEPAVKKNIFHDKVLRDIYDLQNRRDTAGLAAYLSHEKAKYRGDAALGFASVQAPEAVEKLQGLLADSEESVRASAAYALGQTRRKTAELPLIEAYKKEQLSYVKRHILEALGKCGTEKGLDFIINLEPGQERYPGTVAAGRALGLYRFALQSGKPVITPEGTELAVSMLKPGNVKSVRFIAAHYLARARNIDLKPFHRRLLDAVKAETVLNTRMALVAALGKAVTPEVLEHLKAVFHSQADYRVKVNALRSLGRFEYGEVKELFFKALTHKNAHAAVAASEYFIASGKAEDAPRYFETAKQLFKWRTRVNMLNAALKFMPAGDKKNRKRISDWTTAAMRKTANAYEKAWLFNVLAWDFQNFQFVRSRTFDQVGKQAVISTYGMSALARMARKEVESGRADKKMMVEFAGILKQAVRTGDTSIITIAAGMLRDPKMKFKEVVDDTSFLSTALDKCKLPAEIEAWQELKKSIDYFSGKEDAEDTNAAVASPVKNEPIDWQLVMSIKPDQQVRIKTGKGDIVVRLMVDDSPGSAANFIRLIREGFYKKSVFHRVVPNFVIQDGCPRGDGWGGPDFSIGSEFGFLYYEEGCVGMASSGKDTEGSQWFITHSPTPHLDGRYTIFARVIEGMDVVHQIEVGDGVLGFEEL